MITTPSIWYWVLWLLSTQPIEFDVVQVWPMQAKCQATLLNQGWPTKMFNSNLSSGSIVYTGYASPCQNLNQRTVSSKFHISVLNLITRMLLISNEHIYRSLNSELTVEPRTASQLQHLKMNNKDEEGVVSFHDWSSLTDLHVATRGWLVTISYRKIPQSAGPINKI